MSSLLLWHIFKNSFNLGGYTGLNVSILRAASKKKPTGHQSGADSCTIITANTCASCFQGRSASMGPTCGWQKGSASLLSACCLHASPLLGMFPKQNEPLSSHFLKPNLAVCSCKPGASTIFQRGRDCKTSRQPPCEEGPPPFACGWLSRKLNEATMHGHDKPKRDESSSVPLVVL